MKKVTYALKILVILPVIVLLASCNPIENDTTSASLLVIIKIEGTDMEGNESAFLQSDVLYVDPSTLAETIFADTASATVTTQLLDPVSATGPSLYNDIMIERYTVSYFRTDGKNTEGIDVPYSFEGKISFLVEIGKTLEFPFVVVREVAKLEPPLVNLRNWRDAGVLQVQARIDFYGRDMADRNVKATGYLTIFFANYANEE